MEMKSENPPIWESNLKRPIYSLLHLQASLADLMRLNQSRWYWNEDSRKIPTEKQSTIGCLLVPAEVTCLRRSRFQRYELDFTAVRCGWQWELVMRLQYSTAVLQYSTAVLQSTGDQLASQRLRQFCSCSWSLKISYQLLYSTLRGSHYQLHDYFCWWF